jgi:hypothetical protein
MLAHLNNHALAPTAQMAVATFTRLLNEHLEYLARFARNLRELVTLWVQSGDGTPELLPFWIRYLHTQQNARRLVTYRRKSTNEGCIGG